eukprot:2477814-Rhodomonas_salina.6
MVPVRCAREGNRAKQHSTANAFNDRRCRRHRISRCVGEVEGLVPDASCLRAALKDPASSSDVESWFRDWGFEFQVEDFWLRVWVWVLGCWDGGWGGNRASHASTAQSRDLASLVVPPTTSVPDIAYRARRQPALSGSMNAFRSERVGRSDVSTGHSIAGA